MFAVLHVLYLIKIKQKLCDFYSFGCRACVRYHWHAIVFYAAFVLYETKDAS